MNSNTSEILSNYQTVELCSRLLQAQEIMSSKIENFIKDPANRIKDNCPNLGDI